MLALKWIVILVVIGYGGLLALMYAAQRSMMYFPDPARRTPASAGLPQAEEVMLSASDGTRLLAWHVPPRDDRLVVLYFQGNGGGLDLRAARFVRLTADGTGVVALNYRGYGGSGGSPTEAGLIADALAAYGFALARYPASRIVPWGESLGTGVAVALAAQRPVARVILESPYTSIAEVAASLYWFVPVRFLIKDAFRSDERVAGITASVLVLHGAHDTVVPIRYGERLYGLIRAPKRFVRLADAGHNDHDAHGGMEAVQDFLRTPERELTHVFN